MTTVGQIEKRTQARIVALLQQRPDKMIVAPQKLDATFKFQFENGKHSDQNKYG